MEQEVFTLNTYWYSLNCFKKKIYCLSLKEIWSISDKSESLLSYSLKPFFLVLSLSTWEKSWVPSWMLFRWQTKDIWWRWWTSAMLANVVHKYKCCTQVPDSLVMTAHSWATVLFAQQRCRQGFTPVSLFLQQQGGLIHTSVPWLWKRWQKEQNSGN